MKLFTICFLGFVFIDSSSCKVQKNINATELDDLNIVQPVVKRIKSVKTTTINAANSNSSVKSPTQKQKEEEEQKKSEKEKELIQKRIETREKVKLELLDILQKLDSI